MPRRQDAKIIEIQAFASWREIKKIIDNYLSLGETLSKTFEPLWISAFSIDDPIWPH